MKTSLWSSLIHTYIDPNIKGIDKDMYQFVTAQFLKNEFKILEENEQEKALVTIKVIPSNLNKKTLKIKTDITLVLGEKNMSLFAGSDPVDDDSFTFLDERDFYDIMSVVNDYIGSKRTDETTLILNKSLASFKKSSSVKVFKENSLTKTQIKQLEFYEQMIYKALETNEFNTALDEIQNKIHKKLLVTTSFEIFKEGYGLYFPLGAAEKQEFLAFVDSTEASLMDLYIYQTLVDASNRLQIKRDGIDVLKELEEVFSKINIPIAVFDKKQHLVLHNSEFINLNVSVKKVLNLKVNDQVTLGKEVYKVQKVFLNDGDFTHINFIPVREFLGQTGKPSSEELGIVSSSIAHELNNPLGGILAALNVIELDDHSDETLERIEQMREGVLRCKKLVETFLGFSRIKTTSHNDGVELQECFNQAMDLVRFRLIENNIVFNSEYLVEKNFNSDVNPYVISMILYLFFGEIVTNYSHQKLVTQKTSPRININFHEKHNSFEFELLDELKISEGFVQSKLIQHLLETQGLHMAHESNRFRFY